MPEVGIKIPTDIMSTLLAAMRFNYLFETKDAPERLYMCFSIDVGVDCRVKEKTLEAK